MTEGYNELLARLRAEYTLELPDRLHRLEELANSFMAGDGEARKELARRAHMLRGSAGSYGFAEISRASASIEARAGQSESELSTHELQQLLNDLAVAIGQAHLSG